MAFAPKYPFSRYPYNFILGTPGPLDHGMHNQPRLDKNSFSKSVVKRITDSKDDLACPICCESTADNPAIIIPCGHMLCWRCLDRLATTSHSKVVCPTCRGDVQRVTFWKLFRYVFHPETLNYAEASAMRVIMAVDGGISAVVATGPEEVWIPDEDDGAGELWLAGEELGDFDVRMFEQFWDIEDVSVSLEDEIGEDEGGPSGRTRQSDEEGVAEGPSSRSLGFGERLKRWLGGRAWW